MRHGIGFFKQREIATKTCAYPKCTEVIEVFPPGRKYCSAHTRQMKLDRNRAFRKREKLKKSVDTASTPV